MEYTVEHHEAASKGAFFVQSDSARVAEMSYSRVNAALIIVDHTEVEPAFGGQGLGRKLLGALVDWARTTGTKIMPLCPYAKAQFDKDASLRDVLA